MNFYCFVFLNWCLLLMVIAFLENSPGRIIVIQLINLGGTQILIKLLLTSQHVDTIISDVMVQEILWLLGQVKQNKIINLFTCTYQQTSNYNFHFTFQIVQKDAKFAAKVKQLNATKVFHNLLKQHYNQNITLFSLLLIMKCLAQNCKFQLQRRQKWKKKRNVWSF